MVDLGGDRHSIRLRNYDYSQSGLYFVTTCAENRSCLFGVVDDGEMHLNEAGRMVQEAWESIPRFWDAEIDVFVVMPNHVHGIVVLGDARVSADTGRGRARAPAPTKSEQDSTLSTVIGRFKSFTSGQHRKGVLERGWLPVSGTLRQRSFYEHIIRNDADLDRIRLIRARADLLFIYDERGRMLYANDPDQQPAPRLYLAYTSGGYVIRFGQSISDATAAQLRAIVDEQPPVEEARTVLTTVSSIQDVLGKPARRRDGGPAYRFPEPLSWMGAAIQVTAANVHLARNTFPWLLTELAEWWPCFAVVQDGAAVSVCFSSRIGPAVCEAGVETLPAFRRRGYAATVTAAWAAAIRDSGRTPLYSTSWGNLASQGVARRLGLTMFGADVVWP